MERDSVDLILSEWAKELPDVDISGRQVVWRITLLGYLMDQRLEATTRRYDLSKSAFSVLLALLRSGPPYERSPTSLARERKLTSGTMTVVVDQLEGRGLVSRHDDPHDRRAILVRLTPAGKELVEEAHQSYLAEERSLLAPLNDADRDLIIGLLRKLVLALDPEPSAL
jgi:DNA-binding MarR family transcriptional regulator